jgi:hypothetical protein
MYLIMSNEDGDPTWVGGIQSGATMPVSMYVDYFTVWSARPF